MASQVVRAVRNPPANAGDERDVDSVPESGRFCEVGNGNLLQYSCLDNSMNNGAWQAIVHGATRSRTQLSNKNIYTNRTAVRGAKSRST